MKWASKGMSRFDALVTNRDVTVGVITRRKEHKAKRWTSSVYMETCLIITLPTPLLDPFHFFVIFLSLAKYTTLVCEDGRHTGSAPANRRAIVCDSILVGICS